MKHPKTPPEPLVTFQPKPEVPEIEPIHRFDWDDRTLASLAGQNAGSRRLADLLEDQS